MNAFSLRGFVDCASRIASLILIIASINNCMATEQDAVKKKIGYENSWDLYRIHRAGFPESKKLVEGRVENQLELLIISNGRIELLMGDIISGVGSISEGLGNVSAPVEKSQSQEVVFSGEVVRRILGELVTIQQKLAGLPKDNRFRTSNTTYYLSWDIPNSSYRGYFTSEKIGDSELIVNLEKLADEFRARRNPEKK